MRTYFKQEGMVEGWSKTVSALLKVHINTWLHRPFYNLYKNSLECVFFCVSRIYFPPIMEMLCSFLSTLHFPSTVFFPSLLPYFCHHHHHNNNHLCCQNCRQKRVRHALPARPHWRATCTAESESVGEIDWRSMCFFFFSSLSPPLSFPYMVWLRFRIPSKNRTRLPFRATWLLSLGWLHPASVMASWLKLRYFVVLFFLESNDLRTR